MSKRASLTWKILTGIILLVVPLFIGCKFLSGPSTSIKLNPPITCSPSSGSSIYSTEPLLDWEDVEDAAGYYVQVNTSSGFTGKMVVDSDSITVSEYQLTTTLSDDTTYYWRVRVLSTDGAWGHWSATWNFKVFIAPLGAIWPPDGSAITDTTPLIQWKEVTDATGYHFQLNTDSGFAGTMVVDSDLVAVSEYQITTTLSDNATYYWRVRVKNTDDVWGDWSSTWNYSIDIAPPMLLSPASGSTTTDTTPFLNWEDVAGATNYHVQVNTNSNFTGTMVGEDDTLASSQYQVASALSDNTTYYWRVKVKNADGVVGDWSTTWLFTIDIVPPIDPSPTNGSTTIDTTPLLNWEDVTGATGYHVQVNTNSSFTGTMVGEDSVLAISQYPVVSTLSDNTSYYWRVKLKNGDGVWSDWSSTWSFTIDIAPPINPYPTNSSTISDTTPLLNWENMVLATFYHVQLNTSSDFTGTMISEDDALAISQYQVASTLSDNTPYYWRVKVRNADGLWGDWSSTWSFTIEIAPPTNPSSPESGSTITDTTPLLSWQNVPGGATAYHVQLNTSSDFSGTMVGENDSLTGLNYQVSSILLDNTTYYWRVRVKNVDGVWGDWSSTWNFSIDIAPPTEPSPANGSTIHDITPLLDWEERGAIYHLQVNTNSNFTDTMVVEDSALSSSEYLTSSNLSNNIMYYWHVRVKNDDGVWGDWSTTWSFIIDTYPEIFVKSGSNEFPNGSTYQFGPEPMWVGDSSASGYGFEIHNQGSEQLIITSLSITSGDTANFYIDLSGFSDTVAPGSSTPFTVFFKSSNSIGMKSATVTIASNSRDNGIYTLYFRGLTIGWNLTVSDVGSGDQFGYSAAMSGEAAIVGAKGSNSVYFFRMLGGSWVEQQKVTSSGRFGSHVAKSGDWAIVGAPGDGEKGSNAGAAYFFHWDGAQWIEVQKVTASDGAADDNFGTSAAISGTRAIVGTSGSKGSNHGYFFHWNGLSWVQQQEVTASNGSANDGFGTFTALYADWAVIGAPRDDQIETDAGAAYVFHWNGSAWEEQQKIVASNGSAQDYFGRSVEVHGDRVLVLCPLYNYTY